MYMRKDKRIPLSVPEDHPPPHVWSPDYFHLPSFYPQLRMAHPSSFTARNRDVLKSEYVQAEHLDLVTGLRMRGIVTRNNGAVL
jgi:hypothetical protein